VAGAGVEVSRAQRHLVRRNQGLLLFAEQDHKGALGSARPNRAHPCLDTRCSSHELRVLTGGCTLPLHALAAECQPC
jgi:hypothetical protein